MRMKENGELYVIEANANPQLAQGEDFAASAQRAGVPYTKLIERIINLGLQWQPSRMKP
jgi:D-alanine-D-alanine ligase